MREMTSVVMKMHYGELSPNETDELVEAIADLVVDFLKGKRNPQESAQRRQEPACAIVEMV